MPKIKERKNNTVTLSKPEYTRLKKDAKAYRLLAERIFALPLVGTVSDVMDDFRAEGAYSEEFLADMEAGLRKSSYGT